MSSYLRAALIPEPHRSEIRTLLRDYVDVRLGGVETGMGEPVLARSEKLQGQLWAQAVTVAENGCGRSSIANHAAKPGVAVRRA
jgi:hypothetical protein